jgi:hypothetical protein
MYGYYQVLVVLQKVAWWIVVLISVYSRPHGADARVTSWRAHLQTWGQICGRMHPARIDAVYSEMAANMLAEEGSPQRHAGVLHEGEADRSQQHPDMALGILRGGGRYRHCLTAPAPWLFSVKHC